MGQSIELRNQKMLERYRARKQRAIAHLGGECVRCGSTESLEFDHVDPATKSYTITECIFRKWETLARELAKCQLLCEPCHAAKTSEHYKYQASRRPLRAKQLALPMRARTVKHGSDAMYNHYKCRCPACRESHNLKMRAYRASKSATAT